MSAGGTACALSQSAGHNREILTFLSISKDSKRIKQFKIENFWDTIFLTFRSTVSFQIFSKMFIFSVSVFAQIWLLQNCVIFDPFLYQKVFKFEIFQIDMKFKQKDSFLYLKIMTTCGQNKGNSWFYNIGFTDTSLEK